MDVKLLIFALCMLFTGSINTIATKFQDTTVIGHTSSGHALFFKHPALQSCAMFAGEFCCLFVYIVMLWCKRPKAPSAAVDVLDDGRQQRHTWKAFSSFLLPSLCDAGATTLLNLGLYFTFASTFQMLRGTLVIFAGVLTVVLLKRRLHSHHWLGMVLITAGAALVGASSIIFEAPQHEHPHRTNLGLQRSLYNSEVGTSQAVSATDAHNPMLGDVLVVLAQLFAATQFIVEEKYLKKYRVPALLAVGLEGFWGLIISAMALPALTYIRGSDGQPLDDVVEAWRDIKGSSQLQITTALSVLSIACFNFCGVTVTKRLSGAARATIDAVRTLFVWIFSLTVGWESFHALQVLGFIVLISGTSVYNELLNVFLPTRRRLQEEVQEPLLEEGALTWAHETPSASVPVPGWGRPPLPPPSRAQPARPRGIADSYTMARSMRLVPGAFSPHSLASVGFGPGLESEDPSVADFTVFSAAGGESSSPLLHGAEPSTDSPSASSPQPPAD